jgi:flagellar basal body P-ring formation protein FlgA
MRSLRVCAPGRRWALRCIVAVSALVAPLAGRGADAAADATLADRARQLIEQAAARAQPGVRVEVEVGALDPRLKLAPCARATPYLPANMRPWGATRLGVRCDEGARWNVYLPLRVRVFARAATLAQDLPAGAVLQTAHLVDGEINPAAQPSPAVRRVDQAVGRALTRPLRRGDGLREGDLRARQWFAAGDSVRVRVAGAGYTVLAEGQALAPGIEGQTAKVRLEGGRVVSGRPSGPRQLEVLM